jgi:ABC-type transporter Mla subunit MlaD
MSRRQNPAALVGSPLLIGTITVLATVIGIFITYGANKGLPFVPTYKVTVQVPDAANVTVGRDVRVAGKRVGVVNSLGAVAAEGDGEPSAVLELKLDKAIQPIRSDTVVTLRPLSPLGASYVELILGKKGRPVAPGTALAAKQSRPTVALTDAFNLFDSRTRKALQIVSEEVGGGLAGRGVAFNELLDEAPPLVARFERVARNLSDPGTGLDRFLRGAEATSSELAAARRELGSSVGAGEITLEALSNARGELSDSITELVPTEVAGTRALRAARPVLADAEVFLREAQPGLNVLAPTSRSLHAALRDGIPVLRRATQLADQLEEALAAVGRLSRDPATKPTLEKLRLAVLSLRPALEYTAPAQTLCNYIGLAARNMPSTISQGDESGTGLRTLLVLTRLEESFTAAEPVPGLHVNPYAHTGQNGECEAGNEPFLPGTRIGNVPGDQGSVTQDTNPPPGVQP